MWVIIFVAAAFRLWGLGSAETFHDEGAYAFRAIGYLDFLSNESQTTPVQWFRDGALPNWTKLSFHDHPPLYFLTVHIFSAIFGDNLFALRLPSAIAGILSVILIYLILRRITKNEYAGILAAALLAVNNLHILMSRSLMMESMLILFILAAIYAFILFLEDKKRWFWLGLSMGLVALTKYTGAFLVPVFLLYALIFRRDIFKSGYLYAAVGLAMLIFSPVIIYNFGLYSATGHFDLQLSYLFGQDTPEWTAQVGKGQYPFSLIGQIMVDMYSVLFLILALCGLVYAATRFKADKVQIAFLFVLMIVFVTLTLLATGSAQRFVALYLAAFVPVIVILVAYLWNKWGGEWWFRVSIAVFLIYEAAFAVNGIFVTFPDFGILRLDKYLEEQTGSLASRYPPESPNRHLNAVIKKYLTRLSPSNKTIILIYDENISLSQRLWLFTRRTFYHGVTAQSVRLFKSLLRDRGLAEVRGYDLYFIRASENTILNPYFGTNDGLDFESFLRSELGLSPVKVIYGHKNLPMFAVYKFVL